MIIYRWRGSMPRLLSPSRSLGGLLCLGLLVAPASAHEVEVSGDVGGTLHVEPHDNPQAGRTSQVWISLTRRGGEILPLAQCNCQLAVYSEPHTEASSPLIKPPLKAISAAQYQGIPGAEIVFPKQGEYELKLSGTPKAGANFRPFELSFPVTVATGAATSAAKLETPSPSTNSNSSEGAEPQQAAQQSSPSTSQWRSSAIILVMILMIGLLWTGTRRLKR